jgi:glycosyltransferase involved in cell wall biosynthesis
MSNRVIISVTSDLVTDQRVHKVAQTLLSNGFDVLLVGRKLSSSLPVNERKYKTKRFRLWFNRKAVFYMNYNIRLFFFLLFSRVDILLANDLDTLPANYLVSALRRKPLVYDSHEYFTGVPELQHRKTVRKIWERIEHHIFPRLDYVYTVNDSIASLYAEKYHKDIKVVRNVPLLREGVTNMRPPGDKKILIYQGSGINVNRGAEELVLAMGYLDSEKYALWIVGGGDVFEELKHLAISRKLEDRIRFINKVPFSELQQITLQADLGLSFDKPTNLNYLYSLPNKIFDYIHAGLPILTTRLPEIAQLTEKYNIGSFIESHDPVHIAGRIEYMFADMERYFMWKKNTGEAARAYCWQKEEETILSIFNHILHAGGS